MPEHLRGTVEQLNAMERAEVGNWLEMSLAQRSTLPVALPDDQPWDVLMDLEHYIDDSARRNLDSAINGLLSRLLDETGSAESGDTESSSSAEPELLIPLLRTIVGLKRRSLGGKLAEFAHRGEVFDILECETRQRLLTAVIDLRTQRDESFWTEIFDRDPVAYAGIAFAALAERDVLSAIHLLEKMPSNATQALEDIMDVYLPLCWEVMSFAERERARRELATNLPKYKAAVRGAVQAFACNEKVDLDSEPGRNSEADYALIDAVLGRFRRPLGSQMVPGIAQPSLAAYA